MLAVVLALDLAAASITLALRLLFSICCLCLALCRLLLTAFLSILARSWPYFFCNDAARACGQAASKLQGQPDGQPCMLYEYHTTSHHVTSRHVSSCHVTSRHITARHITSHHVTSPSHRFASRRLASHHSYHMMVPYGMTTRQTSRQHNHLISTT